MDRCIPHSVTVRVERQAPLMWRVDRERTTVLNEDTTEPAQWPLSPRTQHLDDPVPESLPQHPP